MWSVNIFAKVPLFARFALAMRAVSSARNMSTTKRSFFFCCFCCAGRVACDRRKRSTSTTCSLSKRKRKARQRPTQRRNRKMATSSSTRRSPLRVGTTNNTTNERTEISLGRSLLRLIFVLVRSKRRPLVCRAAYVAEKARSRKNSQGYSSHEGDPTVSPGECACLHDDGSLTQHALSHAKSTPPLPPVRNTHVSTSSFLVSLSSLVGPCQRHMRRTKPSPPLILPLFQQLLRMRMRASMQMPTEFPNHKQRAPLQM